MGNNEQNKQLNTWKEAVLRVGGGDRDYEGTG